MALKRARQKLAPFLLYDESLMIVQEYENNLSWVRKFKRAVAEDRIIPVFQPIVNNRTAQVEKYETLVRFRDLEGELISPAAFLETARRARLYHEVTRAMARKAIAHFRNLPFEFSINISVDDILNKETSEFLHNLLQEEPEVSRRLVFELTESQEIESYHEVREFLLHVKEHGGRVAIDDFGSGYSNFSYILQLSVDYIKIDASLIRTIDSDANSETIVRTIANFARNLGIRTIAEYVHNEAVYLKVRELGIDFSQGYYFGKPEETTL
jgi:EAL domain-containing protein (putative c-di-GMP-specific phosphodiesterase class I)